MAKLRKFILVPFEQEKDYLKSANINVVDNSKIKSAKKEKIQTKKDTSQKLYGWKKLEK